MQKSAVWLFEKLCENIKPKGGGKLHSLPARQASKRFMVQMGVQTALKEEFTLI